MELIMRGWAAGRPVSLDLFQEVKYDFFRKSEERIVLRDCSAFGACMVPAAAFAADGAAATTQDAAASDDAAAVLAESDDAASSWRFDDGEPIAFPGEELVAGEDAEDVPGDDGLGGRKPGYFALC